MLRNTSFCHKHNSSVAVGYLCCELHVCCNDRTQLFTQLLCQLINITCLLYCTRFWGDENDWITRMIPSADKAGQFYSLNCFHVQPPPSTAILWAGTHTLVSCPDPSPQKAERGSGVLSNISCHIGLQCKECHIYILHPGLEFFDNLDCCTVWFTKT